jgi:hypothetical protein
MSYIERPEDIAWNIQNLADVDEDVQVVELGYYKELYKKYEELLEWNKTLGECIYNTASCVKMLQGR